MKRGENFFTAYGHLLSRNRRRYGGYWIHIGVLVMAFGIIGTEIFQQQTQLSLQNGQSLTMGNYEMVFNGVERFPGPDDLLITEADVDVFYNGRFVKTLNPRTEFYTRTGQPMTIPAARSTISEDFYVLLVNWEPTSATEATFRVYINPLINWVWAGGLIFVLGTLIAAWPDPRKEKVAEAKQDRLAMGVGD
jgi:cytochrome c-type biogenesis protein CcmF